MIDIQTALDIVKTLGSMASMISASVALLKFRQEPDKPLSNKDKAQILFARERSIATVPTEAALQALMAIPDRYLQSIRGRLDQYDKDYQIILGTNGTTPIELKITHEAMASQICTLLDLIKLHNGGELPDEDLFYQELADTFGCRNRSTIF